MSGSWAYMGKEFKVRWLIWRHFQGHDAIKCAKRLKMMRCHADDIMKAKKRFFSKVWPLRHT